MGKLFVSLCSFFYKEGFTLVRMECSEGHLTFTQVLLTNLVCFVG